MEKSSTDNGLVELAEALAFCINALLDDEIPLRGSFPSGWGEFKVISTREARNKVQLHIDAGLFSRIVHLFGDVHAKVIQKEGSNRVGLVLMSRSHLVK